MQSSTTRECRVAEILLVEDNADDVLLMEEAFSSCNLLVNIVNVRNGEKCMQFLRKEGAYADARTPDLILLDLNMPVMNGREVLSQLNQDEALSRIPVVILTTSQEEKDVLDMYELRCSSYIVKPVDFPKFQQVVREIGQYWFAVVVLPSDVT